VAALKVLQPAPLCPDRWERLDSGIGSFFARDRGGSLKRLHRPHRFSVWLPEFEGGGGGEWVSTSGRALIRVTFNAGLRKPRRGFTLVAGKEKLGVGKEIPRFFGS
jgi:hypothetical protein